MNTSPSRRRAPLLLAIGLCCVPWFAQAEAPSRPGLDAPELALLGSHPVGVRTLTLVHRDQLDLIAADPATGTVPRKDRSLQITVWYPAQAAIAGATPASYEDAMEAEPPAPPTRFRIEGIAYTDAKPAPGSYPLVLVAHGYGNVPAGMSWLTENLASKGYVVAAIRHGDNYFNPAGPPQAMLRRPLDLGFVARELQGTAGKPFGIDAARIALIGYSMGGYGVLVAGGGTLDPAGPLAKLLPGPVLGAYARGGESAEAMRAPNVRAVVAFAPAGGTLGAWGSAGLADITAPLMLVAGDRDLTVPYETNARSFFDQATRSNRYLLTFRGGGHALGLGAAPPEMRKSLWDQDWFEDPVWRKDRLIGISLHFVTAFLDRYVKDDASRSAFLDGLVEDSGKGTWNAPQGTPWAAYSPGGDGVTLWKGFQRRHAEGLTLQHATPPAP
ncbi:MAG: alpha/beta hydrolase family protein [Steroidobacteraceae bacterium]